MYFISPTRGQLSFAEVYEDLMSYIGENPDDSYRVIIGSDSQTREETCFVTALIIHRKGKGARYYYTRFRERYVHSLRQRILYETSCSLLLASRLTDELAETGHEFDIEIHLDVGSNGATKALIKEVVGMVVGSGYHAYIKPDAYGAYSVADRYTK